MDKLIILEQEFPQSSQQVSPIFPTISAISPTTGKLDKHERQGQLLLVSLLENFCGLYESNPEKNSKLFLHICKQLSSLGVLQSEDIIDEMSSVRSTYKRAFRDIVVKALHDIKHDKIGRIRTSSSFNSTDDEDSEVITQLSQMTLQIADKSKFTRRALEKSRYSEEFHELDLLGFGAFGQVWQARNKLDGLEYAIKKVRLKIGKTTGITKILREVKCLARLNHPNVVRYYGSWIEMGIWSTHHQSDIVDYSDSVSMTRDSSNRSVILHEMIQTSSSSSRHSSTNELLLFIQMEMCSITLQEWIMNRNSNFDFESGRVNLLECHDIFLDILKGLEYIHLRDCIHRDLKPQNIYNSIPGINGAASWKLGDFGLATSIDKETTFISNPDLEPFSAEEPSLITGTVTYASPEMLCQSKTSTTIFSTQSDIYSLGIIFFELIYPFKTSMERAHVLTELRQGVLPESLVKQYPKESTLILWLMNENPIERPNASQLVEYELLRLGKNLNGNHSESMENANVLCDRKGKSEVEFLKQEIYNLKNRVLELEHLLHINGIDDIEPENFIE